MPWVDGWQSWRSTLSFCSGRSVLSYSSLNYISLAVPNMCTSYFHHQLRAVLRKPRKHYVSGSILLRVKLYSQVMRRKQLSSETVDEFAQDLQKLFERSYGCRQGMDESSKKLLKRNVFVQGLLLNGKRRSYHLPLHSAMLCIRPEQRNSRSTSCLGCTPYLGQPLSLVLLQQNHRERTNLPVAQRERSQVF